MSKNTNTKSCEQIHFAEFWWIVVIHRDQTLFHDYVKLHSARYEQKCETVYKERCSTEYELECTTGTFLIHICIQNCIKIYYIYVGAFENIAQIQLSPFVSTIIRSLAKKQQALTFIGHAFHTSHWMRLWHYHLDPGEQPGKTYEKYSSDKCCWLFWKRLGAGGLRIYQEKDKNQSQCVFQSPFKGAHVLSLHADNKPGILKITFKSESQSIFSAE